MPVIRSKPEKVELPEATQARERTLHDDLVDRACRWLKGTCGCSVALGELRAFTGSGETPDAIGWRSEYSILVECKTSRADFFSDRKKPFRTDPEIGVGTYRFYLSPPDIIRPDDLPEGWGLLHIDGNRIRRIVGPQGNIWTSKDNRRFVFTRNEPAEIAMLVSALRRCS